MSTENKFILSACKELNLSPDVFMSGTRKKAYMDAKRICVGLILESQHITLQKIASIIGLNNHTSIMYLRDSYKDLMKTDPVFRQKREEILHSIENEYLNHLQNNNIEHNRVNLLIYLNNS